MVFWDFFNNFHSRAVVLFVLIYFNKIMFSQNLRTIFFKFFLVVSTIEVFLYDNLVLLYWVTKSVSENYYYARLLRKLLLSNIYNHLFMNVQTLDHITKLLERYFSVAIFIRINDCFIHYLLQLSIFEVVSDHHF